MKSRKSLRTPSLRHHKATGQGFVALDGRWVYLGRFDRAETRQKYHRLIAEWEANGRRVPVDPHDITVTELLAAFCEHAETYFGPTSKEVANFRRALRPLKQLYGDVPVKHFGPCALKAVRQTFIDSRGASSRNCCATPQSVTGAAAHAVFAPMTFSP